jgi:Transposase DDE domain group 1
VNKNLSWKLADGKRKWRKRRREQKPELRSEPMMAAGNIHYDLADRGRAVGCGGVAAFHLMFQRLGLPGMIDRRLQLFKRHMPYFESDHVLNLIHNILAGGANLEDLELLRGDEEYLKVLGARRIPDPTTAGDFLRRFSAGNIDALMEAFNEVRLRVWSKQSPRFFEHAIIDADGSLAPTDGECKRGMDISYDGKWGYHPLVVSLANTAEPLFIVNRPGNRPSHEGVDHYFDRAVALARRAGFKRVSLRGDTDFARTGKFDEWDAAGVRFAFGFDAMPNLKEIAAKMPESAWKPLARAAKYEVKTGPRARPENVKEKVVERRGYEHIRLAGERVAEFAYRPGKCRRDYRVVVVDKSLSMSEGCGAQRTLWDNDRYFFYVTNEPGTSAAEVVEFALGRCNQENLIAQLKGGVHALRAPSNTLESNWAYMVIAAGAWSAKAWFALVHPRAEHKAAILRMEFKTFLRSFLLVPAQILARGRKLICRLLNWNPWTAVFLRGAEAIRGLCLH